MANQIGGGLSPRVRGNLAITPSSTPRTRSIPARAGEPGPVMASFNPARVYPRACGGTLVPFRLADNPSGLSPRVRGNRCPPSFGRARASVYPRACGGTPLCIPAAPTIIGLSPRVRGNRTATPLTGRTRRSIPARAGEPPSYTHSRTTQWVYPRACGGIACHDTHSSVSAGLSPRVRGNP